MKRLHANSGEGASPYTCAAALRQGGPATRLSALVMGLGNMANGQILKGLLFLAVEVAYIFFMIRTGIYNLSMLVTLGSVEQEEVWDEAQQVFLYTKGDQSILLLLYGVATILLTVLLIWAWRGSLRSAYKAECLKKQGSHVNTFREDLASLLDENLYRLLMTPPMFFIGALTILPLIFMICMAFTNYSKIDNHLVLFDWVGLDNFATLFDSNSILGSTFWSVLIWTLVWAVFATFTNYIFGMILALLINRKETKAKGFWRFCFVLSSAVPMFVSLLIMRTMLQPNGAVNVLLRSLGLSPRTQACRSLPIPPGRVSRSLSSISGWAFPTRSCSLRAFCKTFPASCMRPQRWMAPDRCAPSSALPCPICSTSQPRISFPPLPAT